MIGFYGYCNFLLIYIYLDWNLIEEMFYYYLCRFLEINRCFYIFLVIIVSGMEIN